MPPRTPDHVRAAILDDIRAGTKSCRAIAAHHGVSHSTVSSIAKAAGLDAFDRSDTKKATEAAQADNAADRARIARRFLLKADELLDQMDLPHTVFNFGGKDNTFNSHTFEKPPTGDLRNLIVAAATAVDKHMKLDLHDREDATTSAVDAWLRAMTGGGQDDGEDGR